MTNIPPSPTELIYNLLSVFGPNVEPKLPTTNDLLPLLSLSSLFDITSNTFFDLAVVVNFMIGSQSLIVVSVVVPILVFVWLLEVGVFVSG